MPAQGRLGQQSQTHLLDEERRRLDQRFAVALEIGIVGIGEAHRIGRLGERPELRQLGPGTAAKMAGLEELVRQQRIAPSQLGIGAVGDAVEGLPGGGIVTDRQQPLRRLAGSEAERGIEELPKKKAGRKGLRHIHSCYHAAPMSPRLRPATRLPTRPADPHPSIFRAPHPHLPSGPPRPLFHHPRFYVKILADPSTRHGTVPN